MAFREEPRAERAGRDAVDQQRARSTCLLDIVGGRGEVVCALLETAADEAQWVAGQIARLLSLPLGTAPDGSAWPASTATRSRAAGTGDDEPGS